MRRCGECEVAIDGAWESCPLCGAGLEPEGGTNADAGTAAGASDPYPAVPLKFSRRRVARILLLSSLGVIAASLAVQLLFGHGDDAVGVWRSLWLGVVAMWLLVITAVNERRNVARTALYLVVIVGLVCVYWDYLSGWHGWALTYAVPAMCGGSAIALTITLRVRRVEAHEHVVFSGMTMLLGVVPLVFMFLGWVTTPWPAAVCGGVSVLMLLGLQAVLGAEVRHELARYLHL